MSAALCQGVLGPLFGDPKISFPAFPITSSQNGRVTQTRTTVSGCDERGKKDLPEELRSDGDTPKLATDRSADPARMR